jgi:hypothetical protein
MVFFCELYGELGEKRRGRASEEQHGAGQDKYRRESGGRDAWPFTAARAVKR